MTKAARAQSRNLLRNASSNPVPAFKPNFLALAVAAATGFAAPQALGQQEEDEDEAAQEAIMEEIVVTGYRGSLQNAMRMKRDSQLILEAISAEDIGKLPDNSIAESLTRLTGLAGQRLNGRQQLISIRGLAPDFSTALLNGRQQVSAGDNRGVEFDQYPSELLSGVVVYKTPSASLSGQGLAGTVDMQTINPLDHDERTIAANVRYEWNEINALNPEQPDSGERYSISYIDRLGGGDVGFAVGYSHISSPTQRQAQDIWGYSDYAPAGGQLMTGTIVKAQSGVLDRDGLVAVLEFAPNERMSSKLDLYYSKFDEKTLSRQVEYPLFPNWFGWYGTALSDAVVENGVVTSGTFTDVKGVLSNNLDERDANLWAVGWNLGAEIGEAWTATLDVGYSTIDRSDLILATNAGTGPGPNSGPKDTLRFEQDGDGARRYSGALDYADPNLTMLTSPMGWGRPWPPPPAGHPLAHGQMGYVNRRDIEDELTQIRVSAERYLEMGPVNGVQVGVQYDTRSKSHVITDEQGFLGFSDGAASKPFTSSGVVATPFGMSSINTWDPLAAYRSGLYVVVPNFHGGVLQNDWEVNEDVLLGYVEFNVETSLGSVPVTGNVGVQIVMTDQESTGVSARRAQNASPQEARRNIVTGGADYTEILPALNLNFEIAERRFLRLGLARTLARARMDEMRASQAVNFNPSLAASTDPANSPWGGSGGNPALEPWIADGIDVSFEWYFDDGLGYMALAGFYKELRTYIYDRPILADFSNYPTGDVTPALRQGIVSRPDNGEGGNLQGLEFSLSLGAEMLMPALEGLGVVLNASFTDSEIDRGTGDPSTPLPGLSEEVANLTVYYERGGFSARVSRNYRSDFLGEVAGFGAARTTRSLLAERLLDAQVSYGFEEGALAGLTLYLQGTNLTDEPFVTYVNDNKSQVKDFQVYGSTWLFGLSYRL